MLASYQDSKLELAKIASVINNKPYVIEFTGTPRTGKTTIIHILEEFFKKGGFTVKIVDEFTTSKYYKEEIYPNIKDKSVLLEKINELKELYDFKEIIPIFSG